MAKFLRKQDLSKDDQAELARIEAKSSGLRTTTEANFLTALDPYRTNRILRWNTDSVTDPQNPRNRASGDLILEAEGNTLPTGDSGFQTGAIFYDLDKTGGNVYRNTGTSDSAIWTAVMGAVASPSKSASPSASASRSLSPSASTSKSESKSASPSASGSKSKSPSPSLSPSASESASASKSLSPSASGSASGSKSASKSSSASLSPSGSGSASASKSA